MSTFEWPDATTFSIFYFPALATYAVQFLRQLLRIDGIINLHVVRLSIFKFFFRRADNQPKHFLIGVVEDLSQQFRTNENTAVFRNGDRFIADAHTTRAFDHKIKFFGFRMSTLETIIERLETSNPKSGKIAFARRLGLVPAEAAKFIQYLSELRNTCAHLPRTYNFDLRKNIGALRRKQRAEWLRKVNFKIVYPLRLKPGAPDMSEEHIANPRLALFRATFAVILYLHCEWIKADYEELKDIVDWLEKKRPLPRFPEGFDEPSRSRLNNCS